ncbi:hypothetical protein A3E97_00710 [Candidatus Uhrbacteria bacterium RIFCSPHIGHO2_12_FULL_47_12]|uniref:VWFA domain-containing protein n=1 Tax=Candidatus Uhrbacteria bacterium RIFCSPLOWO2_02_FULL_48_18 TaxID=1802408 RepID=A0A1F7V918_9BACT|nr:MAG: hypothetical protein A3E97_00710 [Candidatus Uhrbacteria bacterium RIFCSPHIGHO2_12_FULL_47_12]OGL81846.1 MAG: hypothetical protein A3B20_02015 [Candidatus Uhrbacteria bacterium RIFCSPLOWO2_01_FULL_47_17]OGL87009.1 MAG: hypothetical protein A3I41_03605 [Candidatus Uhrbacteria bacterium RIFCSPLOWO2_02_FULL_48_18]OGL94491.1 MAG: hypothetical protein A3H12_00250 [Candidatus Uhrbacteria bacterium RIFCSPLOWO2_12_FULL_47_9]
MPDYDPPRARATYTHDANRSYAEAEQKGTKDWDLLPESITTAAENALLLVNDMTGSMSSWPITVRTKALYLDHELRTMYLSEDTDVAFCAFGDAMHNERYPLQVREFTRGKAGHEVRLGELVHTKGGGGGGHETSELAALYIARNVHVPNQSRKPIVIFNTDEAPYDEVTVARARDIARVKIDKKMTTKEVFAELTRKFSVYLIQKPYDSSSDQAWITKTWEDLIGADHIALLPDENRIVDVIFGILGHYSGKIEAFKRELESRQTPEQVRVVMAALKPIFANAVSDGRSITHGLDDEGNDVGSLI